MKSVAKMKVRPQIVVIGMALTAIALYALHLGSDNVASVCSAGLVGVVYKLAEHD